MDHSHHAITEAWAVYIEAKVDQGWAAYLASILFNPLCGGENAQLDQMRNEIERIYATFLPRVTRKPRSANAQGALPIWLCWPDLPVFKRTKQSLLKVKINDGLHYQGVMLQPPISRIADIVLEFEENDEFYRRYGKIAEIDIVPFEKDTNYTYVVDYARKSLKRCRRSDLDDHLILPKSLSELPTMTVLRPEQSAA